jgi:hypothetical protein
MKAFFDSVRASLFGGAMTAAQVAGCNAILRASRGMPLTQRAYLLATAYHETATSMEPIKETVMPHHKNKSPSDAEVIRRLDAAWAKGALPQVKVPYWRDGWFGRGFVQLTWRNNYERAGRALGLDLIGNPSLAMVPEHAAAILARGCAEGWFTGRKLGDYTSYVEMRRVVNGLDRAEAIAGHARKFEAALRAVPAAVPWVAPPDKATATPVETIAPPSGGFFMRLWRAILGAWK